MLLDKTTIKKDNTMKELESEEFMRAWSTGDENPPTPEQLTRHGVDAHEFQFSQKLVKVLRHRESLEVKGLIQAALLERGLPPEQSFPRPKSRWWAWLTLGLVSLGLAIVVTQYLTNQNVVARRLAQDYLVPLENVLYTSDQLQSTAALHDGMEAYSAQQYPAAIAALAPYYQQSGDRNAGLFLAISYLLTEKPRAAESILRDALAQPGPVGLAARWYLALCLLQQGELDQVKQQLELINTDSPFFAEAQRLMDDLNP